MIPIENEEIYRDIFFILYIIVSFVIGMITRKYADIYATSKNKISRFRELLDTVDEALIDDKVSEEEFRKTFYAAKELISE